MRILITGGNGYVGRHLVSLLHQEHDLCILDRLRYGGWCFPEEVLQTVRLEAADIRDPATLQRVMISFEPEVVVHLAAIHYIPECEADPALAVSTNVDGTLNVLLASPTGARFVFASSGAVYRPEERPHSELNAELSPSDIYGLTKLHGEHYVRQVASARGLQAVIVRLFNVIGPGETNPHLLPEIVAQLKAGRDTIELGNLSPKRDYVSVRDAAAGFRAVALGREPQPGETCVVNLGTSSAYSVIEVVEKLRRISGHDFRIRQADNRLRRVDRPYLAADTQEMARLFGWSPQYTIDDALADLWSTPELDEPLVARYRHGVP
jgi:UDP-glucose 4-epimerase